MRNIVITGGELFNKGAQAMVFIAVSECKKRFPDHEIYVLSPMDLQRPPQELAQYAFQFTGWYPTKFAQAQHRPLLRFAYLLRHREELLAAEALYRNTDLMLDISGYALGSNWSDATCNTYLEHLEFAAGFNIPVYLMPQSFGPFDFGEARSAIDTRIRRLLPKAKAIMAREQEAYDALTSTYNLTNVHLAPDLVLNNKGIDLKAIYREPPVFHLPDVMANSIAVIPNNRNVDVGNRESVLGLYCSAIRHALISGKHVYLLRHSSVDAQICTNLKDRFADEPKVILLEQEFNCLEFNALVKAFDYLVASRFHSVVHAFKNGVPCITLGWAGKYAELLAQFDQSVYLFDVRQNPSADMLTVAMDRLDHCRSEESVKILSHLSSVQENNVFDNLKL